RRSRPPIRREPAISEYHGVKPVGIYKEREKTTCHPGFDPGSRGKVVEWTGFPPSPPVGGFGGQARSGRE
ncbi:hypothetical protein CO015_00100, partial [candidate division WWE3 bacterium CG_4_8_14_3_um_filter_42_11]